MNYFRLTALIIGVVLLLIAAITPLFVERIEAGYVGLVYKPNGGVQKETLSQGWHSVSPFDRVIQYPTKRRTIEFDGMVVNTSDGKNLKMKVGFNYYVDPTKVVGVYNTFGPIAIEEIENGFLRVRLGDALRRSTSKFSVIDLYGSKIGEASTAVTKAFSEVIGKDGFVLVDTVVLGAPVADEKTQAAIDARVKANQMLEQKKIEKQIAIEEAERAREEARGIADAALIKAQGQAKANAALQQSITKELIQYELVKQLPNIKFPAVMGGNGTILNMPESLLNQATEQK